MGIGMGMGRDSIEFRGGYRFHTRFDLDRAMSAAHARILDDDLADLEPDWLTTFVRTGTRLSIDTALPLSCDRYVAAEVLHTLAAAAIDGMVEIRRGARCLDWFPAKGLRRN